MNSKILKPLFAVYISREQYTRLREDQSLCRMVGVFIQTGRFNNTEKYAPYTAITLNEHTDDFTELLPKLQHMPWKKFFKAGFKYKKAGVALMELIPKQSFVPDLFCEMSQRQAREKLSNTVGDIQKKIWSSLCFSRLASKRSIDMAYETKSLLTGLPKQLGMNFCA